MTFKEGDNEVSLWNEDDGMYYDAIHFGPGNSMQLPVHSLVGLIPLYGTLVLEPSVLKRFPGFKKRVEWFLDNRPEISTRNMANMKGILSSFISAYCYSDYYYDDVSWWQGATEAVGVGKQGATCQNLGKNVG